MFPRFMKGVKEVHQLGAKRLHWKAEIGGKAEEWDAEIFQQIPDVSPGAASAEQRTQVELFLRRAVLGGRRFSCSFTTTRRASLKILGLRWASCPHEWPET